MIQITATEAEYMRKNGYKNMVHKSYTKHPTYYLVETPRAVKELKNYQNTRKVGDNVWKN